MTVREVHGEHPFPVCLKQSPRREISPYRHHIPTSEQRIGEFELAGKRLDGINHLVLGPNSVRATGAVLS